LTMPPHSTLSTSEFLSHLRDRDVRLWVEDGRLKCDAPPGVLEEGLRVELTARKQELLAVIAAASSSLSEPRSLVPLKPTGDRPPLFARPGHIGDVFCYRALAERLDSRQPLYGVEPRGLHGDSTAETVEEMAAYEVAQIQGLQPHGPYYLAGYCAGGAVTFESARQLVQAGEVVARVLLLGCPFPDAYRVDPITRHMRTLRRRVTRHAPAIVEGPVGGRLQYVRERVRSRANAATKRHDPSLENRRRVGDATMAAVKRYYPESYAGRVDVFFPSEAWRRSREQAEKWRLVARECVEHVGPAGAFGDNMLREPHVRALALLVDSCLSGEGGPSETV
jgi:thioesterase domain-containing protein